MSELQGIYVDVSSEEVAAAPSSRQQLSIVVRVRKTARGDETPVADGQSVGARGVTKLLSPVAHSRV